LGGLVEGSGVTITGNDALTTFGAFAELESASALTVASNLRLESIELGALLTAASLTVTNNDSLRTLDLESLTEAGTLTVVSNVTLTDVGTLEALTEVETLVIAGNPLLPQCFVDELEARLRACTACEGNDAAAVCR
jgi:hypothetical protein